MNMFSINFNLIIKTIFAIIASWVIISATPYFRLNGPQPQVDTQVIFLHGMCGIFYFYQAIRFSIDRYELNKLFQPLIFFPFLIGFIGIIASLFSKNFNTSMFGSAQIGQGVFWYFDLAVMILLFANLSSNIKVRWIMFINLFILTSVVSIFTIFPSWKGIPLEFYYFTDYLCFYGVLTYIVFTTLTKNFYFQILGFLLLGYYFTFLDNNAATICWITTFLVGFFYLTLKVLNKYINTKFIIKFLYSDYIFTFVIFLFSALVLFSSLYFWSTNYRLPLDVKFTILEPIVVRGKIIENSLAGLDSFKNILIGNGWGMIPDLLLENMSSWQYDQLRLGLNLHFHSHNELAEHFVALGLIGGITFLAYIFFIIREAGRISFSSKLGWLLFFKINCFWFLWTGTLTVFAIAISSVIYLKSSSHKYLTNILKNRIMYQIISSCISLLIGSSLIYASYKSYAIVKMNPLVSYGNIYDYAEKNINLSKKCLPFYDDGNRSGFLLERFLASYGAHVMWIEEDKSFKSLMVLQELQCKANDILRSDKGSALLLSVALKVDADYYYKLGNTEQGVSYFLKFYDDWYMKAKLMSKNLKKRGDLLSPYLSYAINNGKSKDAVEVCDTQPEGIEAFCSLVRAYELLERKNLNKNDIRESIKLIKDSIDKGIFNELVPQFWWEGNQHIEDLAFYGIKGIPLAPDILFLISDEEKKKLEDMLNYFEN